jgi:hypothetical protein
MLACSKHSFQQPDILQHPAIKRGAINLDAVLLHHFLELTVADRISPTQVGRQSLRQIPLLQYLIVILSAAWFDSIYDNTLSAGRAKI